MNDEDLNKIRGVIKEEIGAALVPINERLDRLRSRLDSMSNKVDTVWEQTVKLTEDMTEVKETLNSHTVILKNNNENLQKLDKRVTIIEDHLGRPTPSELAFIK